MTGHDNDGKPETPSDKFLLQRQAVHARHLHVHHHATDGVRRLARQERRRGGVGFRFVAGRCQQHGEGIANGGVVVDDENRSVL